MKLSDKQKVIVVFAVALLIALVVGGVAIAALTGTFHNTATIPTTSGAVVQVAGVPIANGDTIAWGNLAVGQNSKAIAITNTGNTAQTIGIAFSTLPAGVTATCDLNGQSVASGQTKTGTVILTVDLTAAPGAVNFDVTWSLT